MAKSTKKVIKKEFVNPLAWLLNYAEEKSYKSYDLTKIYSPESRAKK